ncbi:MAG: acyl-CoA dehydrogenase family protein [Thermoplasmata archaeon]|nr:acyl-CoA dehydrogenase family protein [Thermoplasmata archaeon]
MDEEHKVLESVLREFSQKEIEPVNKNIEIEGLSVDLKNKLASQGFLGALAPLETGGANLDRLGYTILLREIASASPSAAFYIFLQNSLVIKSLMNDNNLEIISKIASGKMSGSLAYSTRLNMLDPGHITKKENRIEGVMNAVFNSSGDIFIVNIEEEESLYLIESGFEKLPAHEQLGFRGVAFSPIKFNSEKFKKLSTKLDDIIDDIHLPVAAIAIGIANGALSKAISYAKERDAFLHKLKDFQPLAFNMSQAYSELDSLNSHLISVAEGQKDLKKELMIKTIALDFARRTSKLALQVHGGYGYLMDFGVEKFYRDAMFLSIVGGHSLKDKIKLAELIFESKAGWI